MPDLKDLAQHRKDILLAEVAAWLHDVGKLLVEHVESQLDGGSFSWPVDQAYKVVVKNLRKEIQFSAQIDTFKKPEIVNTIRANPSPVATDYLPPNLAAWFARERIQLCSENHPVGVLISLGTPGFATNPNRTRLLQNIGDWLPAFLGVCHHIAHHDKQEPPKGEGIPQYPKAFQSSPFGYSELWIDLSDFNEISHYQSMLAPFRNFDTLDLQEKILSIQLVLRHGLADTRWPINEVSLYDWGATVAALFKAGLVYCLHQGQFHIDGWRSWKDKIIDVDIHWRLLSIRTDGLEYLLSAPSIPDLLARKDLLTNGWNRVQKVLEEVYPLGLEVYRDENGPVFVVPDLDNLLGLSNSADNHKTLREYILEAFRQGTVKDDTRLAIGGEVVPYFELSRAWSGQKDPGTGQLDLPPIGEMVAEDKTPPLQSDPEAVAQSWDHLPKPQEVCTVCGLRPQGPRKKAKDRKMCDVCEERRADRAKAWAANIGRAFLATIWLDEVADKNRRLALIVGTFDLSHWLDGTLVRSLAVRNPANASAKTADEVAKNPSFARLRRVWETTRRFWQDVAPTDAPPKELEDFCKNHGLNLEDLWEGPLSLEESLAGQAISEKRPRLFLKGMLVGGDLGPFHAYEMMVQGRKVAVLWVPPNATNEKGEPLKNRGGFWVIENLAYLESESVFGRPVEQVFQQNGTYEIYEPSEYGRPGRATAQFVLEEKKKGPAYTPLIPILAEPRTFMALVPAEKAVDVVRAIKTKYEREMGKVRNRLPLHLGIVFADAHQPLRTILDAGRRMLRQQVNVAGWKVTDVRNQPDDGGTLPERFKDDVRGQFAKWYEVELEKDSRKVTWYVPAVMGDGKGVDYWYPYVFVPFFPYRLPSEKQPGLFYLTSCPYSPFDGHSCALFHISELQPGDVIYFTPATLDFTFLDRGGRRFEIAYGPDGRRRGTLHRPYLLDELDDLIQCWKLLAGDREKKVRRLSTTQLHAVRDLIENKRTEWFEKPEDSLTDETFRRFCESVLQNAEWQTKPTESELTLLTHWAVTSLLADAVDLFYHIMKQRPVGEEKGEV